MFTYVGLIQLTDEGQEKLHEAPVYLGKIKTIIEEAAGRASSSRLRSTASSRRRMRATG